MTKDEARPLILAELRNRLPEVPHRAAGAGIAVYMKLKQERPDLFRFRCAGDQWQVVHGWMRRAGLVTQ